MIRKRYVLILLVLAAFFAGCSEKDNGKPETESITLSTEFDLSKVEVGEYKIHFNVKTAEGNDVTEQCTYTSNGQEMADNGFIPSAKGSVVIKANYKGLISNEIVLDVKENTNKTMFQQYALIEDYTGTWCGYCPRVAYAIEQLEKLTDKALFVAIHAGKSDPMANNDIYKILEKKFKIPGFPTAIINRRYRWIAPEQNNLNQITDLLTQKSRVGIAMTTELDKKQLSAKVKVKFSSTHSDLKLVVAIVEDSIKADQANYTSFYGGLDVIQNFTHNHVLIEFATDPLGDEIPDSKCVNREVYTKDFDFAVPAKVANSDNMKLVAYVVRADASVINARACGVNETLDFEELKE